MSTREDVFLSLREHLMFLAESGLLEIAYPATPGRSPVAGEAPEAGPPPVQGDLEAVRRDLGDCRRCPLAEGRRQIVFGEGNPDADILFVGEGPGEEEDRTGRPFVGRAGKLLTDIIEKGMKILRGDVYICNIVKCRPPGNRTPLREEVNACLPFLLRQIEAVRPRVIVTLGRPAASTLLGVQEPMTSLRGRWASFRGIPLMPTFHPSYVLRRYTVEVRRQVYEDTLAVMSFLEKLGDRDPS